MTQATTTGGMNPQQFIAKWQKVALSERAASQEHFIDLCRLLGQPTPASYDATGAEYTFEKGVPVTSGASKGAQGSHGFADVWWRGKFGWEYKRKDKHASLDEAYRQLLQYREALDNPPLLIVCDIARVEIHTNFTGTAKQVHVITLDQIDQPENLDKLRRVFTDPYSFRSGQTPEAITEQVAQEFGRLAQALHDRGHEPHDAAHFLMKCMFCLFAEDVELLPSRLFSKMLAQWRDTPADLAERLSELFDRMADGGAFGFERIPWFNGGLFRTGEPALLLELDEINVLIRAGQQDWSQVEPSIFGTLFERSLDPTKRAQIGAHYTSRDDILLVVEPVVMRPLRRRWEQVQAEVEKQVERRRRAKTRETRRRAEKAITEQLQGFLHELAQQRILDPACGSGNFLYVAIQQLLDLEKQIITFAARPDIALGLFPTVRPTQLHGLEVNPYAAELAQVVIWIGYLQWMRANGFNVPRDPILEPIETIEHRDAILAWRDEAGNKLGVWRPGVQCAGPAPWPEADFIIGNPPFLGVRLFRQQGMEDEYIQAMYGHYEIPNASDLCCYWFERARQEIERRGGVRVGLLATQGVRGGANRTTLQRILSTGGIFEAWSDKPWVLEGAAVQVSIVCFDDGTETQRCLNGAPAATVHANLSSGADLATAARLTENRRIAFMGDTKGGSFEFEHGHARMMLASPNPNGRSTLEVVRPWINGADLTRRPRAMWIVDFGCEVDEREAAGYELPYRHVHEQVRPLRINNRRRSYAERWWIHVEPRPAMRERLPHDRFVATPNLTKHRVFCFVDGHVLPDHQLIAFARSDDYFFGVLHSNLHEIWARAMGTQFREAESGFRYTPTTCFETFPLPWPPGDEPTNQGAYRRIAEAAKELDEQRQCWLNPPQWVEPIAAQIDAEDDFADVAAVSGEEARRLIRDSAIQARAAKDKNLKKRTLTNLYNERPAWLALAHRKLDEAVLAAYAAVDPEAGWDTSWAEVWQDTGAGQPLPEGHEFSERRSEIEQCVLANLLPLNQAREAR